MKKNNKDYLRSELERLDTSQLDEMLHAELQAEAPDANIVLAILNVIEKREEDCPVEITEGIGNAWKRFTENCAEDEKNQHSQSGRKKRSWVARAAAIAAVVCVLLMAVPQAVGAETIFEMLARWSASIFEFFDPSDVRVEYEFQTNHPGLQQIYDAVAALGVTQPVVPTWVPEGYELTELKTTKQPAKMLVYAIMSDGESRIIFSFHLYNADTACQHAKDKAYVTEIELSGITHYIMSNDGGLTAAWSTENIECSICVDSQEDVLYKILDSIYTTEGIQ